MNNIAVHYTCDFTQLGAVALSSGAKDELKYQDKEKSHK